MMISNKSLKNFVYINSLVFLIGMFEHSTISNVEQYKNNYLNFLTIMMIFLSRNYLLLEFISYNLKNKENINKNYTKIEHLQQDYKHEFLLNLVSSTTIETVTYIFIKNMLFGSVSIISMNDIIYFIPKSFVFELIFDFFHYSTHYLLHSNKFLYVNIHKKHHKFSYPLPIITFYQCPLDLVITNSVPQFITLIIFPRLSLFQFNIILTYKSFIEISGHSSKKLYPNGSFSQFIWLPRALNISLYSEDHTLHHSNNNCNYSKRFSIWDKVFGTYKSS
jgi:sterol desaturase/sphingolipid hydroxylase (fatty acid hydroxylase superfamily)